MKAHRAMKWLAMVVAAGSLRGGLASAAELRENIAPHALAIPSTYPNPINDGKAIVFGRSPEFADGRKETGYRLLPDQPGRLEFHFEGLQLVAPGRCEVLTQMEMVRAGHVEVLRGGKWIRVADLSAGAWTVAADWTPESTHGVAVVLTDVTDLDHEPVRVMEVRLLAAKAGEMVKAKVPALHLGTTREHHVFSLGDTVRVQARLDGKSDAAVGDGWVWRWQWDDFVNRPIDAGGSRSWTGQPVEFTLTPEEQGPLLLKAWLAHEASGAVVASSVLLVGVRDPEFPKMVPPLRARAATAAAKRPTRADVVEKMQWGAEIYHRMLAAQFTAGAGPMEAFQRGGLTIVGAYQDLAWFEPLPGVFNFAGLDSVVQGAEAHGLGVELGLWRWYYGSPGLNGPTNLQYWLEPWSALKRDGTKGPRWLNVPSLHAAEYRAAALRASEVFFRRYREHPAVLIWHPHPFGIVDHDFTSTSTEREAPLDYSPHARRAFAEFLRKRYGAIGALNARYGASHAEFTQVPMPEPLVKAMPEIRRAVTTFDNRPAWRDYLEFRDTVAVHGFQSELFGLLRELDPERPISGMANTMANSAVTGEVALRTRFGVYYGDQNTETPAFIRRYLGSDSGRLPFRGEDHSPISPRRFPGDYRTRMNEFFFNCATAGVNQLNYVFPVWEENPAWAMFASPALRDAFAVNAASTAMPAQVGLLHSFTTGVLEGFTSYAYIELHRWLDLIAWSETMMVPGLWAEPLMIDAPPAEFSGKRLLIDNDSRVLTPEAVAALVRFVEAGGALVIQRTSGQYSPDRAEPTWALLRALDFAGVENLRHVLAGEALVTGEGPLAGMKLPLRDVSEITQPGATPVATLDGKVVAAVWSKGRGHVLLLGGAIGDYSLAENRQRLLEGKPGAWAGWSDKLAARTEVFRTLTTKLQGWSGVAAQGVRGEASLLVMGRETARGYSIVLRNPADSAIAGATLRVPVKAGVASHAAITFPESTATVSVETDGGDLVITLPEIAAGGFCLVQF